MNLNKTLIEYSLNNNTVKVLKIYNGGPNNNYAFIYANENNRFKNTIHSKYKKIGTAMKIFNKAVNAIKNGTNIK